jgi:hypothetical protein
VTPMLRTSKKEKRLKNKRQFKKIDEDKIGKRAPGKKK